MCGILGILAFGELPEKKQEKLRQESMIYLSSELLQLTQTRGKDATGIATMFSDCGYMGLKMGIPPTDFVSRFGGTEKDFDGYLTIWRKRTIPAKMVLGHCRKSSVGNSEDNTNNHPIKVGNIIGVHNGTLTNHNQIFELLKCDRDGTVDSEAIFRLLHFFTNNGKEPFAPEVIQEVCKRLHGTYACLAFAGNNPYQMIGFRDSRPIETLLIKPLKLLLIASEKDFLKHVIFRYNKMANLYQTGLTKFKSLKKSDVELSSLIDDSLYIFDVRKDVNSTSKIDDLFISEKVPRNNKIWGPTYAHIVSPNVNNQNINMATKRTAAINYPNKSTIDEEKDRIGMAWNKKSEAYEWIVDLEKARTHASVEIDLENGEVVDVETKTIIVEGKNKIKNEVVDSESNFNLNCVNKDIDSPTALPAKLKELSVPVEKDTNKEPTKTAVLDDKAEVVLETYPEVLEKAEMAFRKETNFGTIKDVQLALEIEKEEDLKGLPVYSLANRIKKFFYKKGWYNGHIACLHETQDTQRSEEEKTEDNLTTRNMLIRANNKRRTAEKNIRIMKDMVRIFSHITTEYDINNSDGIGDVSIDKAVDTILVNHSEINTELIKSVFKPGDFKNIPILGKITSSIAANRHKE